jgi:hypothetical protein
MIFSPHSLFWELLLTRSLDERVGIAPADLVGHIARYNIATNNPAVPGIVTDCSAFLDEIRMAVAELPDVLKAKLAPRLLGIFAMTGLGSSAVTDVIAYPNGDLIGAFIAIDIDAFAGRRANEWASWKENDPFAADSSAGVQLEAIVADVAADTRHAAIQYILLHEFGHVMAAASGLLPNWWEDTAAAPQAGSGRFASLCWTVHADGKMIPLPGQDFPLRRRIRFYEHGKLPADDIPAVYRQLAQSAFPTLYASTSVHEDFAECFATYVHTELLGKPWEIIVRASGTEDRFGSFWMTEQSASKRAFFRSFFEEQTPAFPNRAQHAAIARTSIEIIQQAPQRFLGLAPFLRLSTSAHTLQQIAAALLQAMHADQDNPYLWMNLSTVFFASEQRALGLEMQAQGLALQRTYLLPAMRQPAKCTLLMLMAPGDLAENAPLDCLLENSNVDFIFYYTSAANPLPSELPAHDVVMVAFSDTDDNRPILQALERRLHSWPQPVLNVPQHIPNTERSTASTLLQGTPGLLMPPTASIKRDFLQSLADGVLPVHHAFIGCRFPIILRPVGSHAGRDLERIADAGGIAQYLARVDGNDFYLSNFIDYRSADGLYRKYRIAIVDGRPFASHMAISSHWMIHYVNAGMYDDAMKRAEEAAFMENFAAFAGRHGVAFQEIHRRSGLDYICIDCAEASSGELLIFEIDHAMVVHAMDPEELFPFKQAHMLKVQQAVEALLHDGPRKDDLSPRRKAVQLHEQALN